MTNSTQKNQFGVNLWWHVPEFVVDGEKAQEALFKYGFEKEDMPLPSRRNVVSRAAHSFQDRRHKEGKCVVEKLTDNADSLAYGILWKKDKGVEEAAYEQDTTVRMDKADGRVQADGPQTQDFFTALKLYDGAITDDDVRLFLRRIVRMCKGVSKRFKSGGIYFIPEQFVSIVESAQYMLDELNIGAKLYLEGVVNGERERSIVWDAVANDIETQLEATLSAVERIEKRASAVKNHEAKLGEMQELMDIYRDLLGKEAEYEELAERLKDASSDVAAKLDALQQETPAPSRKPSKRRNGKRGSVGQQVVDAVMVVLEAAGKPMHYAEIAKQAESNGFELRGEKSGAKWLNDHIGETFRNGRKSPFKRHGRGVYSLA